MALRTSIDIGTNTALLLVGEANDGHVNVIREEQRVPRLGRGVDKDKYLSDESIDRVLKALNEYKKILAEEYPEVQSVVITATSAVRDASNRDQFCQYIEQKTGWPVKILSGLEEAEWTYAGAISVLTELPDSEYGNMILDIGGGSTEIAYGKHNQLYDSHSFNIGSVRFTERYFKHDPPLNDEIAQCRKAIAESLKSRRIQFEDDFNMIGVAGTVTSLAFIELGLSEYDPDKINGYVLTHSGILSFIDWFSEMTHQQMIDQYPEVMTGRADIFMAGLLILETFLDYYDQDKIIVSTGGIRHGALMKNLISQ
ncbi:MAG TPA: Ppx/GppA phosphatase family protein [Balneolales bacterium]|nr:Ppx/GppA phosphatase family protein [Balneolales bacterium]